METGEK